MIYHLLPNCHLILVRMKHWWVSCAINVACAIDLLKKDQICKKCSNIYRQVHHQVELGIVARVGGVERAVGHEALVQHVLVAGHAHHLRLLLEVEVDGPAEVGREVGY